MVEHQSGKFKIDDLREQAQRIKAHIDKLTAPEPGEFVEESFSREVSEDKGEEQKEVSIFAQLFQARDAEQQQEPPPMEKQVSKDTEDEAVASETSSDADFLNFDSEALRHADDTFDVQLSQQRVTELLENLHHDERVAGAEEIVAWFNRKADQSAAEVKALEDQEEECSQEVQMIDSAHDSVTGMLETRDMRTIEKMRRFYMQFRQLCPKHAGLEGLENLDEETVDEKGEMVRRRRVAAAKNGPGKKSAKSTGHNELDQQDIAAQLLDVIAQQQDEIAHLRTKSELCNKQTEAYKAALDYIRSQEKDGQSLEEVLQSDAKAMGEKFQFVNGKVVKNAVLPEAALEVIQELAKTIKVQEIHSMLKDKEGRKILAGRAPRKVGGKDDPYAVPDDQRRFCESMEEGERLAKEIEDLEAQLSSCPDIATRMLSLQQEIAAYRHFAAEHASDDVWLSEAQHQGSPQSKDGLIKARQGNGDGQPSPTSQAKAAADESKLQMEAHNAKRDLDRICASVGKIVGELQARAQGLKDCIASVKERALQEESEIKEEDGQVSAGDESTKTPRGKFGNSKQSSEIQKLRDEVREARQKLEASKTEASELRNEEEELKALLKSIREAKETENQDPAALSSLAASITKLTGTGVRPAQNSTERDIRGGATDEGGHAETDFFLGPDLPMGRRPSPRASPAPADDAAATASDAGDNGSPCDLDLTLVSVDVGGRAGRGTVTTEQVEMQAPSQEVDSQDIEEIRKDLSKADVDLVQLREREAELVKLLGEAELLGEKRKAQADVDRMEAELLGSAVDDLALMDDDLDSGEAHTPVSLETSGTPDAAIVGTSVTRDVAESILGSNRNSPMPASNRNSPAPAAATRSSPAPSNASKRPSNFAIVDESTSAATVAPEWVQGLADRKAYAQCKCGSFFKDDSVFCRKCGEKRDTGADEKAASASKSSSGTGADQKSKKLGDPSNEQRSDTQLAEPQSKRNSPAPQGATERMGSATASEHEVPPVVGSQEGGESTHFGTLDSLDFGGSVRSSKRSSPMPGNGGIVTGHEDGVESQSPSVSGDEGSAASDSALSADNGEEERRLSATGGQKVTITTDKAAAQIKELLKLQKEQEALQSQLEDIEVRIHDAKAAAQSQSADMRANGGRPSADAAKSDPSLVPEENRQMRREVGRKQRELNELRTRWVSQKSKAKGVDDKGFTQGQVESAVKLLLRDGPKDSDSSSDGSSSSTSSDSESAEKPEVTVPRKTSMSTPTNQKPEVSSQDNYSAPAASMLVTSELAPELVTSAADRSADSSVGPSLAPSPSPIETFEQVTRLAGSPDTLGEDPKDRRKRSVQIVAPTRERKASIMPGMALNGLVPSNRAPATIQDHMAKRVRKSLAPGADPFKADVDGWNLTGSTVQPSKTNEASPSDGHKPVAAASALKKNSVMSTASPTSDIGEQDNPERKSAQNAANVWRKKAENAGEQGGAVAGVVASKGATSLALAALKGRMNAQKNQ